MRPERLRQELNRAIQKWIDGNTSKVFNHLLPAMKKQWKVWAEDENDFRNGVDTYGYDNVYNDMMYISDRWRCAFRLKWIIDGIENGSI